MTLVFSLPNSFVVPSKHRISVRPVVVAAMVVVGEERGRKRRIDRTLESKLSGEFKRREGVCGARSPYFRHTFHRCQKHVFNTFDTTL